MLWAKQQTNVHNEILAVSTAFDCSNMAVQPSLHKPVSQRINLPSFKNEILGLRIKIKNGRIKLLSSKQHSEIESSILL